MRASAASRLRTIASVQRCSIARQRLAARERDANLADQQRLLAPGTRLDRVGMDLAQRDQQAAVVVRAARACSQPTAGSALSLISSARSAIA